MGVSERKARRGHFPRGTFPASAAGPGRGRGLGTLADQKLKVTRAVAVVPDTSRPEPSMSSNCW